MKKYALSCIIAILALVWAIFFWNSHRIPIIESRLKSMVDAHVSSFSSSEWLLEEGRNTLTLGHIDICRERRETLIRAATAWCPDHAMGAAIKAWLPQWGWAVEWMTKGTSQEVNILVVNAGREMIVLVPRSNALISKDNPAFFCNEEKNGRAVFARALKMPDQIYAAFLLHEIGHAEQYWNQKRQPGTMQEVEMHTLSYDVLNAYSKGVYGKAVVEIVSRSGKVADFRKVFRNLKPSDLSNLDHVVGSDNSGKEVERNVVVQHLLSIGFEAVNKSGGGVGEKVEVYEWVSNLNAKRAWQMR